MLNLYVFFAQLVERNFQTGVLGLVLALPLPYLDTWRVHRDLYHPVLQGRLLFAFPAKLQVVHQILLVRDSSHYHITFVLILQGLN